LFVLVAAVGKTLKDVIITRLILP